MKAWDKRRLPPFPPISILNQTAESLNEILSFMWSEDVSADPFGLVFSMLEAGRLGVKDSMA
jgi:hypothetical protein